LTLTKVRKICRQLTDVTLGKPAQSKLLKLVSIERQVEAECEGSIAANDQAQWRHEAVIERL
jgi:hypothetical protein